MTKSTALQVITRVAPRKNELPLADSPLARQGEWSPLVWLVAAHGGAGATALARALAPCGDAGQQWPVKDESRWCVIVARSTRTGIEAAHDAALQAQADKTGKCRVLGIVLVEDTPGKTPKAIEQRISVLERVVPSIWRVPYIEAWREALTEELPEWSPLDDEDEPSQTSRFGRKKTTPSAFERVPESIAEIGSDLVDRAREANSHL